MDCPDCGEQNPHRAKFCLACGTLLTETPRPREVRKVVTVLFGDVTGSTSMGEQLDPEALRKLMNRYFEEMKAIVERYEGTVVDFIGDAVMAVFGIPQIHEDDALRAARAAWDMQEAIPALSEEMKRRWGLSLSMKIGMNTGVVSGDATAGRSMVLGDAVNVAARLEKLAQPGDILIGEDTCRMARDAIAVEPIESLEIKGKEEPVKAFRLVRIVSDALTWPGRLHAPMVGRDRESLLLHQALERCIAERTCHLFTIMGPAGVGKSRLVQEVLRPISGRVNMLQGRCLAYGEGITFWPLAEAVDQAAGLTSEDSPPAARAKIARVLKGQPDADLIADRVAQLIGLAEGNASREDSFWAVRKLLETLASEQGLVLVLDDIHWAEPTLLDLVEHVIDWTRDAPILVICLARPELLEKRQAWGGGKFNATSILMEPLKDEQCASLIEKLLGTAGLDAATKTRITESAEGNPLFVEEMLSMLIDDGLLIRDDGAWVPSGDISQLSVPPTIQGLLAARLDRLEDEERPVIEAASVIGKEFTADAVLELSPDNIAPSVNDHLNTMIRKQLIRPETSTYSEDSFRFRHILIRDVAYEGIPKGTRAELHERFATWVEKAAGDRLVEYEEILAYHLERSYLYQTELAAADAGVAELAKRAFAHLVAAGRRALAREDLHAVETLLSRGLALSRPDNPARIELAPDLASALSGLGSYSRARNVLEEAIDAARGLGDQRLESYALLEHSLLRIHTEPEGVTEEILGEARRALDFFEGIRDDVGIARARRVVAESYWARSQFEAAHSELARGIVHARAAGDVIEELRMLSWLPITALWGPVPVDEGLVECNQVLEASRGNLRVECNCLATMASLEAMRANFDHARELMTTAQTISEDVGTPQVVAGVCEKAGLLETLAENHAEAEKEYARGYEIVEKIGEKGWVPAFSAARAAALCSQGRYSEAERYVEVSRESAQPDDADAQIEWRRVKAKVVARRGDVSEAERLGREAIRIADATDFVVSQGNARLDLAEILQLSGQPGDSQKTLAEAAELFEQKGNVVSARKARSLMAQGDRLSGPP
ncbi:MAG: AAA family ATPase [Actinomycetota bacterium]|nr:AAA family ATPase [Actinomycetota bacterium]